MTDARTRARRKGKSGNPKGLSFRAAKGFPRPLRGRSGRARFATLKQATRAWNRKGRMGADASEEARRLGDDLRRPWQPGIDTSMGRIWRGFGVKLAWTRCEAGMEPANRDRRFAGGRRLAGRALPPPHAANLASDDSVVAWRSGSRIYSKGQLRAPFKPPLPASSRLGRRRHRQGRGCRGKPAAVSLVSPCRCENQPDLRAKRHRGSALCAPFRESARPICESKNHRPAIPNRLRNAHAP